MPPSPLLTQLEDVPPSMFCGEGFCSEHEICECINLIKIPLGSVVEFMIVDTSEYYICQEKTDAGCWLKLSENTSNGCNVGLLLCFCLPFAKGSFWFLRISFFLCPVCIVLQTLRTVKKVCSILVQGNEELA